MATAEKKIAKQEDIKNKTPERDTRDHVVLGKCYRVRLLSVDIAPPRRWLGADGPSSSRWRKTQRNRSD